MVPQSPGPLLGGATIPIKLQDLRARLLGDANRPVGAP